jgi:hypothetical protein
MKTYLDIWNGQMYYSGGEANVSQNAEYHLFLLSINHAAATELASLIVQFEHEVQRGEVEEANMVASHIEFCIDTLLEDLNAFLVASEKAVKLLGVIHFDTDNRTYRRRHAEYMLECTKESIKLLQAMFKEHKVIRDNLNDEFAFNKRVEVKPPISSDKEYNELNTKHKIYVALSQQVMAVVRQRDPELFTEINNSLGIGCTNWLEDQANAGDQLSKNIKEDKNVDEKD